MPQEVVSYLELIAQDVIFQAEAHGPDGETPLKGPTCGLVVPSYCPQAGKARKEQEEENAQRCSPSLTSQNKPFVQPGGSPGPRRMKATYLEET